MEMEILRGDIFFANCGRSPEDPKIRRPVVIVSNNTGNHFSEYVEVVFLTTKEKKSLPTHVKVVCKELATAQCENIFTIKKDILDNYIRTCTDEEMKQIDDALMVSLGINKGEIENTWHPEETTPNGSDTDADIIKLQTERDLYKKLYEQMLEKMCG